MRIPLCGADLFGSVDDEEGDCHVVTHLGTLRGDPSAFDFSQAADRPASGRTHHRDPRRRWQQGAVGGQHPGREGPAADTSSPPHFGTMRSGPASAAGSRSPHGSVTLTS